MIDINEANKIKTLWVPPETEAQFIQKSESHVYKLNNDSCGLFLRVTSENHRKPEQIKAELDYVLYLNESNAKVSVPVASVNGNYIETFCVNGQNHYAVAFIPAKGEKIEYKSENWSEPFFKKWGAYMGKMHNLSDEYIPADDSQRWDWKEDKIFEDGIDLLKSKNENEALNEFETLEKEISCYTKKKNEYGLIHGDLCTPNFFYKDGVINAFDFDDSCYHWYMYEISISLWPARFLPNDERQNYMNWLVKGYLSERSIEDKWLERIPALIRLRNLYMFIYRLMNIEKFNIDNKAQWFSKMRESFVNPVEWNLNIDYNENLP